MFVQTIADFIAKQKLFSPDDSLLLAVSGGMDSMVLLHVLHTLGYKPGVAHCNFQLRGQASDLDEALVRQQAESYELPCYVKRFDTAAVAKRKKQSIQETAREQRYDFFASICSTYGYAYVLTAHHLDDRLETFWLNFSRGTGLKGISSLRAVRDNIRRPLLAVNRAQIAAYQQENEVAYREDSSNEEDKYRRNHFRHHILPLLYQWDPALGQTAFQNFERLEQIQCLLEEQIARYRGQLCREKKGRQYICFNEIRHHAARETISWEILSAKGFTQDQVRQVFEAGQGTILRSPTHELLLGLPDAILRPIPEAGGREAQEWHEETEDFKHQDGFRLSCKRVVKPQSFPDDQNQAWVDSGKLKWPLYIRYWQAGDVFCPLGMEGRQQKLKDFFINNKINQFDRHEVPILLNADGHIIWIVGHRLDDRFKLTKENQEVLCFKFSER